jgi:DNA modification methylase
MWTNPGDVVLTPFMGVGSEVYFAIRNDRKAIGIELKLSYFKQAIKNVAESLKVSIEDQFIMKFDEEPLDCMEDEQE